MTSAVMTDKWTRIFLAGDGEEVFGIFYRLEAL